MQKLLKYYIFKQRYGRNVGLPKQAHALLRIIENNRIIEKTQLLKCMAFNNELKTKQKTERILIYYAGFLIKHGCIEVTITTHKKQLQNNQNQKGDSYE
jgi:hypothetical protein